MLNKKLTRKQLAQWQTIREKSAKKYQAKLKTKKIAQSKNRNHILKKSTNPIAKKSDLQKKRDKKYYSSKKKFLSRPENEMCNMRISPECIENRQYTVDLHHMRGKCGDLYWDMRYFMATCRVCHNYELNNDAEAKQKGVSLYRNRKYE